MLEKLYNAHVAMDEIKDTEMMYHCMDRLEEQIGEKLNTELGELLIDYTAEVEKKGFFDGFKCGLLLALECMVK